MDITRQQVTGDRPVNGPFTVLVHELLTEGSYQEEVFLFSPSFYPGYGEAGPGFQPWSEINNFEVGVDKLDLSLFPGITSMDDMRVSEDSRPETWLRFEHLDEDYFIILSGVTGLSDSDFLFA